uniref:peptidylprolyl isomerase n=1 Tax=Oryza meridionalis TaxID=40149 RepID=A0A0E0CG95_9ORYZ
MVSLSAYVAPAAGVVPPPQKTQVFAVAEAHAPTIPRRHLLLASAASTLPAAAASAAAAAAPSFAEIPGSGGVKALDLREGPGEVPADGDQVAIHYYGRLAAKQGWRFDSTYDHKDETGDPMPFVFTVGAGNVIPGIEAAVKSMRVGGLRRVIIPPSQGYQNTSQEPIPPNFFDRQRLFTTIFNPTRLANGEGSTLGTLIFDIELISIRQHS